MHIRVSPQLLARLILGGYGVWSTFIRHRMLFAEPVLQLAEQGELFAFALWHDEMFNMMHFNGILNLVCLVSQSKDGDILAETLKRAGIATTRGSSSRGGVKALVNTYRLMRRERLHAVLTVDGPRGPRHKVKDGIFLLAHKAPARIVPVRAYMTRKKVFHKAWDKFQVPLPGARVIVAMGEPYELSHQELDPEILAAERLNLEERMAGVDAQVRDALTASESRAFGL